jgi:hypothetical protein
VKSEVRLTNILTLAGLCSGQENNFRDFLSFSGACSMLQPVGTVTAATPSHSPDLHPLLRRAVSARPVDPPPSPAKQ